jgi:hypothetical protein
MTFNLNLDDHPWEVNDKLMVVAQTNLQNMFAIIAIGISFMPYSNFVYIIFSILQVSSFYYLVEKINARQDKINIDLDH